MPIVIKSQFRSAIWFALVCIFSPGLALADASSSAGQRPVQAKESADNRTLDEELLEGLGIADPLADLEGEAMEPSSADESVTEDHNASIDGRPAGNAETGSADGLDDELMRGLEGGEDVTFGPADNPLVRLNQRMRDVQRRIADAKSDGDTQRLEQDIARELADLIKQAEQACRNCQKKGGPPSTTKKAGSEPSTREAAAPSETAGEPNDEPARESSERLRKDRAASVDPAERRQLLKDVWGHLPAHLRQQMEQSVNEEFLPKYSVEIAEYYRALVERRRRP